jgi:hypothetical protein
MVVHSWKSITFLSNVTFSKRTDISVVLVLFNETSLGGLTVMDRGLDLRFDKTHLSDNTLYSNKLVDEVSFETSGSDVVFSKITFKIYMINLRFLWKTLVLVLVLLLHVSSHFATIFLEVFYFSIELIFKHFDGIKWFLQDVLGQCWIEISQFINVDC